MNSHTIHRFKQIYELEKFQIAFYLSQLSSTEDLFYHKAFTKIVQTEKKHARFFAQKLTEADLALPKVGGTLAELAGSILGESIELTGPVKTCKMGVALENKTQLAYQALIKETGGELKDKLMEFLLEEEFHALWLQDYAKRLKYKEKHRKVMAGQTEEHPTVNVNMSWI